MNNNEWNEVMNTVKKHETLQVICNQLYTDQVRTSFRGLTREQITMIYEVYTNTLNK